MVEFVVGVEYTEVKKLPLTVAQALEDRLRYLSPDANGYNFAYSTGRWDGFVRLYDKMRSRFPTGLLERAKRVMKEYEIEYTITTNLPALPVDVNRVYSQQHELRPYQEEAVAAAIKWRRGVLSIPTGGGKTEVAQSIIHRAGCGRVVFLVPSLSLLTQTVRRMRRAFPSANVLQWGSGKRPPDTLPEEYILIATVQSAFKTPSPYLHHAGMVFVDESHHQSAESFQQATRSCANARYIFGLSATPYRNDGTDLELEAWIGPIVYNVSYSHLIENGWLVPPSFRLVYSLEEGLELTKGKRTLIFSEKLQDLHDFKDVFDKHGAVILNGKDPVDKREKYLKLLASGEVTHIAATPLFDEGLDVPDIEAVFFFATCGARTRAMQRIGRAMRPAPGKTQCLVVDLLDDKYRDRMVAYTKEPAFASRL